MSKIHFVTGSLSTVSNESNVNAAKRAYENGLLPTGVPFIGVFLASSYRFICGYLYLSGGHLYGAGLISTYSTNTLFSVNSDTWTSQTTLSA